MLSEAALQEFKKIWFEEFGEEIFLPRTNNALFVITPRGILPTSTTAVMRTRAQLAHRRVPPVMKEFCLAISTGDFNEGVTKMASTSYPFSFALWDEYEMFEFDLGNTFNYSDLANLMAPRPFMAQRGHSDGVAWDEFVGYEYALVRQRYAKLKIPERTEIYWFDGGHEIAVEPAIKFFDRFLR